MASNPIVARAEALLREQLRLVRPGKGTFDPGQVLEKAIELLRAKRKLSPEIRTIIAVNGFFTRDAGGIRGMQYVIEQTCGRIGYFKGEAEKKAIAVEHKANKLDAEQELKKAHAARVERNVKKHISDSTRARRSGGDPNLTHYDTTNLVNLARQKSTQFQAAVRNPSGEIQSGVAMVAAVWDPVTTRYYTGRSGHEKSNPDNKVPPTIWDRIRNIEVDPANNAFGTNCAEVDCLIEAFAARAVLGSTAAVTSLPDMVFVAFSVGEQVIKVPCESCRTWITHFHATSVPPPKA